MFFCWAATPGRPYISADNIDAAGGVQLGSRNPHRHDAPYISFRNGRRAGDPRDTPAHLDALRHCDAKPNSDHYTYAESDADAISRRHLCRVHADA